MGTGVTSCDLETIAVTSGTEAGIGALIGGLFGASGAQKGNNYGNSTRKIHLIGKKLGR